MSKLSDMFSLSAAVKSKVRLWVEYVLIGLVVILLCWAAWGYTARLALKAEVAGLETKVEKAENRVALVEQVNQQQAEAIDTITSIREVDGTILEGLARDMELYRVRDAGMRNRIATLEKSNEAVRKYLSTAVPAPVGCVLDQTCPEDGNGSAQPAPTANDAGKAPGARAKQDKR